MTAALILAATIAAVLALAFLPSILSRVLDPANMKLIRAHCEALGLSDIDVQAWPNHYGVSFRKNGKKHYARCRVAGGMIKWKGNAPEQF